jgi:hypothetical protein
MPKIGGLPVVNYESSLQTLSQCFSISLKSETETLLCNPLPSPRVTPIDFGPMYSPVSRSDTVSTNSSRNSSMSKFRNPRRKVTNYKTQAEKSQQPPKFLRQDSYPTYRLKWEKLKAFLERKFPNHTFEERRVCCPTQQPCNPHYLLYLYMGLTRLLSAQVIGDKYIFDIPESLKSVGSLNNFHLYPNSISTTKCCLPSGYIRRTETRLRMSEMRI